MNNAQDRRRQIEQRGFLFWIQTVQDLDSTLKRLDVELKSSAPTEIKAIYQSFRADLVRATKRGINAFERGA